MNTHTKPLKKKKYIYTHFTVLCIAYKMIFTHPPILKKKMSSTHGTKIICKKRHPSPIYTKIASVFYYPAPPLLVQPLKPVVLQLEMVERKENP